MKRIILFVFLGVCNNSFAYSLNCNGGKPTEYCYSWFTDKNTATGKVRRLKINFNVSKGQIDTSSVCTVHEYGSVDAIKCKREAYNMFREFCRGNNTLNKNQKRIFCDGYNRFIPSR